MTSTTSMPVAGVSFFGLGISGLCLLWSLYQGKRARIIDDTPTCKTAGVFIGAVELKGTAEVEAPLTSPLTGCACVYYAYTIDERWERGSGTDKKFGWARIDSDY